MLINHDREFVFIDVPRTASRSIRAALSGLLSSELHPAHTREIPVACRGYFTWCVVRNPYARVASHFAYRKTRVNNNCYQRCREMSFADYVDWTFKAGAMGDQPFTSYLEGITIDRHLLYENLGSELRSLPFWDRGCESLEIPHLGNTSVDWQAMYNQETADAVWRGMKEDFANVGYSRESWRTPVLA